MIGDIKARIDYIKWDILALAAYTVLSIIFTYPVAFSANKIPGEGDVYWYLWDLWWFKKALSGFISPYYTYMIFHPVGADLAFSEVTPINAIASIPLQFVMGLVNAYNLIWLLTFILSGYGTFLLVRYLTGNAKAAFVSGLTFAFCPYRFGHALGHLNLISTEFLPFYILYLIRTVRECKSSSGVYAGLFLLLSALSSYYYLVYLLAFTLAYIAVQQIVHKNILSAAFLKRVIPGTAIFVIGMIPFIYPMAQAALTRGSAFMYVGGFVDYSADLLAFFIPASFHPLFKDALAPVYANFTGGKAEFNVFLGYVALSLAIIAWLKARNEDVKFWSLIFVSSLILSLGPVLHINGVVRVHVMGQVHGIPLPYFLLTNIPIFSAFRAPGRWDVLVMLSIAVLSGFGLSYLAARYRERPNMLYLIVSCLVLFEYLSVPYPMASAEVPAFYEQISRDGGDYAILDMPTFISPMITFSDYMYYQTVHGKRLVEGYASRIPDSSSDFINSMPFVSQLMYLPGPGWGNDIMRQNQSELGRKMLKSYNIKYVIVHKDRISGSDFEYADSLLRQALCEGPINECSGSLAIYEVKDVPKDKDLRPPMDLRYLGRGWHNLEIWGSVPARWMGDNASIILTSQENRTAILSCEVTSIHNTRTLGVSANGSPYNMSKTFQGNFTSVKALLNLKNGTNTIRLQSIEGCERPIDMPGSESRDSRCLSMAFQNISID